MIVHVTLLVLLSLAALFWVQVLVLTVRQNRAQKWVVKADTPLPPPPRKPKVSVVIPARNEERNLKACLDSVRALEWPALEIVLIDDRSTDATPRIAAEAKAADPRVTLLGGTDLPPGWMGKCWALHQASAKATGEWLLFLDADVTVHPKSLAQAHAYAVSQGARMLSGYGFLVLGTFWENVIMPVIGGMIVGANPLDEVNDPKHPRVVCNGQFILIERAAYDAIGGHEALKAAIIDDVSMAKAAKEKAIPYRMIFCRELFRTRMYTSFREIWQGWTKNLYAGLDHRWHLAIWVLLFVGITTLLPVAALGRVHDRSVFALAATGTTLMLAYRIYSSKVFAQDWRWFWSHPLGALLTCGIFANSALKGLLGRDVTWKGRAYKSGKAP